MNKVTVLVKGSARVNKDNSWQANSTCTLIESKNLKIIVDPGCDRKALTQAFKKHNLVVKNIDWVFVTHRHLDHSSLIGIFPNAKVIDEESFQHGSHGAIHKNIIPDTDIKILQTPGHAPRHGSLLVKTKKGTIAIAGDVFYWTEKQKQTIDINQPDDFADGNFNDLKKSRQLLLSKADFIIPGHGKMFLVE